MLETTKRFRPGYDRAGSLQVLWRVPKTTSCRSTADRLIQSVPAMSVYRRPAQSWVDFETEALYQMGLWSVFHGAT